MRFKLFIIIITSACVFYSCKKDKSEANKAVENQMGTYISDEYGRQLVLHGLNTSSNSKYAPDRMPWISEENVEREANQYGFNFVRLLMFWDFIEPEQGVFNSAYLDDLQKRVEWYTSRGVYVMLDMHQDLYSIVFGGDGAPLWAIRANGASLNDVIEGPWWLKNISPAVINSWTNFWEYKEHKDLQDHYIKAWKFVAERFKSNPRVIGYDLMNEPWGGDLIKAFITGEFERKQLSAFYNRLIPELRTVESQKYFFFEPAPAPITFGMPSNLPKIEDANGINKLVYAPHCYPLNLHEDGPYKASDKKNLKDWSRERIKEVKKQGDLPLLCGEFGVSPEVADFDVFLHDFFLMLDTNAWNWTYWSNDTSHWSPTLADGSETPVLQYLVRPYPRATAGRVKSFNFDEKEKVFSMEFVHNAEISMPTEIFVPQRHYLNGFNVEVETNLTYHYEYNEATQILSLFVEGQGDVSIKISSK